ncbi:hypothetical protein NA56DRAFT_696949 [Hyaloscypha hepaticicola]|uniref:Uncharacterized protein n=1 Tax=Hyaloscypha hepaticicola TaxID=2082293 RepID=A0A2J6QNU5_9HELO|nr:hypothetical protein NA56DRAFT_696949 [Hyaloscypha hepaticicola]
MNNPSIPGSVGFQGVGIWADGQAGQTAGVARPDPVPEPDPSPPSTPRNTEE